MSSATYTGISILKLIIAVQMMVSSVSRAETQILIEAGAVWQHRNDVQIPPDDGGTRVEFDRFNQGPFLHYRAEASYFWSESSGLRLLFAPFSVSVEGTPQSAISFDGETFAADVDTTVDYTFNSYRASYIYRFLGSKDDQFNLGFTVKIRQAEITFSQGSLSESYDNIGFVPLIYLEWQKALTSSLLLNFQSDALAGGPGRAIDVSLKLRYKLSKSTLVGLGYRTLEGGADNDEVFTFSWFNYSVADLVYKF